MHSQKIACEMCALNSSWGNDEGSFKWDASSILFWKAMENFRGKLCLEFSYGESGLSPRTLCTGACTLGLWRNSDTARRCCSQRRTWTTIQLELGSGSGGSCKNSLTGSRASAHPGSPEVVSEDETSFLFKGFLRPSCKEFSFAKYYGL